MRIILTVSELLSSPISQIESRRYNPECHAIPNPQAPAPARQ